MKRTRKGCGFGTRRSLGRFADRSLVLIWMLLSLGLIHPVRSADQPQWGQAWSRNLVSGETGLPDSFDPKTGKNIKWTARLGTETHSSPVIGGGRIYIGTNNGEPRDPKHQGDRGVMMCFEEKSGRFLWQLVVPKRSEDIFFDWPRSGMSSPATVEGDRVYLVSNRGEVMCLDALGMANGNDGPFRDEGAHMTLPAAFASGTPPRTAPGTETFPESLPVPAPGTALTPGPLDADILWLFDLPSGAGTWPHDAAHSSILIHGDFLYLNTGTGVDNTHKRIRRPEAPSLVVFEKKTGQFVARDGEPIAPRIFHSSWSSPALAEVNGRTLLFFIGGNGVVYAFEPVSKGSRRESRTLASGNRNSDAAGGSSESASSSPAPNTGVPSLKKVWQFDLDPTAPKENVHRYNSNRRESPSNVYGMPIFSGNRIYVAGGGDIFWGKNEAWLKCIDATKTGDITQTGLVWSYPLEKHVMSTPAVHNGLAFISDCGRKMHCVDAETGLACWTHEIKGEVWASPFVADGKVYLGTRSGTFSVFRASREKEVLNTMELGEPISSTVTAANGVLYVATMSRLHAVAKGAELR